MKNYKPPRELEVEFVKIVGEGKALGRKDGKVVFCYGILPGETARVKTRKEKRNYIEAELLEIIKPSEKRVPPKEDHYLSCSPWQIMDYDLQTATKKNLAEDLLYQSIKENVKLEKFYCAEKRFGYRTKIEYSFSRDEYGKICLAFHKRGNWREKWILSEGCALIAEDANKAALKILSLINEFNIPLENLKSLIIRRSENTGSKVAVLYAKTDDVNLGEVQIEGLDGFFIAYSNPLSPMSTADAVIYESGKEYITENIRGKKFYYGFDCFFQNNVALFEKALDEISESVDNCRKLADLYSGVGIIGISLADKAKNIFSLESNKNSVEYAKLNAKENGIENISFARVQIEKSEENLLKGADIVVADPPRAGIHKKAVKMIMEAEPEKIIYLSCNPITQGRDAVFFLEKYDIEKAVGFDFYPNTPHMETLLVFEKK